MEVEFAFLARAAEPGLDGTLNILGADFGRAVAPAFPVVIPGVVAVVKFKPTDDSRVRLKLRIDGPEGPILTSGEEWAEAIASIKASGTRSGPRLTVNTPPVLITGPGTYTLSLTFEAGGHVDLPLEISGPPAVGDS